MRGVRGSKRGARGSEGSKGSEREQQGSDRGVRGARGSEGSKTNVILGFKAPTTSGRKTLMMTYSAYVSPPPWKYSPHPMPMHIATKGLHRSHHRPKILGQKQINH